MHNSFVLLKQETDKKVFRFNVGRLLMPAGSFLNPLANLQYFVLVKIPIGKNRQRIREEVIRMNTKKVWHQFFGLGLILSANGYAYHYQPVIIQPTEPVQEVVRTIPEPTASAELQIDNSSKGQVAYKLRQAMRGSVSSFSSLINFRNQPAEATEVTPDYLGEALVPPDLLIASTEGTEEGGATDLSEFSITGPTKVPGLPLGRFGTPSDLDKEEIRQVYEEYFQLVDANTPPVEIIERTLEQNPAAIALRLSTIEKNKTYIGFIGSILELSANYYNNNVTNLDTNIPGPVAGVSDVNGTSVEFGLTFSTDYFAGIAANKAQKNLAKYTEQAGQADLALGTANAIRDVRQTQINYNRSISDLEIASALLEKAQANLSGPDAAEALAEQVAAVNTLQNKMTQAREQYIVAFTELAVLSGTLLRGPVNPVIANLDALATPEAVEALQAAETPDEVLRTAERILRNSPSPIDIITQANLFLANGIELPEGEDAARQASEFANSSSSMNASREGIKAGNAGVSRARYGGVFLRLSRKYGATNLPGDFYFDDNSTNFVFGYKRTFGSYFGDVGAAKARRDQAVNTSDQLRIGLVASLETAYAQLATSREITQSESEAQPKAHAALKTALNNLLDGDPTSPALYQTVRIDQSAYFASNERLLNGVIDTTKQTNTITAIMSGNPEFILQNEGFYYDAGQFLLDEFNPPAPEPAPAPAE